MLKNHTIKRLVFGIVISFVLIPPAIITAYAGAGGRIAGWILISLIGMFGYFEVLTAMKFSKFTSLFCSLSVPVFMILPYTDDFKSLIWDDDGWTFFFIVRYGLETWIPWVALFGFSLLPIILDWKNLPFKKLLQVQFFILLITYIIPLFSKSVWLVSIHDFAKFIFFALIAILSDTLAYFGGMLFGKKWFKGKKLAPKISPKKTWAGFVFPLFFVIPFAILYGYFMNIWDIFENQLLWAFIFGILLTLISPAGDLLFSLIKRKQNIKDFSKLIPGHGGLFDRLDAMSVVFCFGMLFFLFA